MKRRTSPQVYARIGGLLYLFIFLAAPFGEFFIRDRLIVHGNAAATAQNIMGSETLFRVGIAGEMLTCVCDVVLALILYVLLRPVSRNLALLAAFMRLTFVGIYSVAKLFELLAVAVLGSADYLKAFDAGQLQALSYLSLRLHGEGYDISLIFFGWSCLVLGYLIFRSNYLPKALGVLLAAGGLGYQIGTFTDIVAPVFAANLYPWVLLPAFVGELSLCLWLIVKGVDVPKWEARARE
jgi:hypothetical protein